MISYHNIIKMSIDRLLNYKSALLNYVDKELRLNVNDIFVKWIFLANMNHKLDDDLVPFDDYNIIVDDDIKYLCEKYKRRYKKIEFFGKMINDNIKFNKINHVITKIQSNRLNDLCKDKSMIQYLLDVYFTLGGLNNLASFPLNWLSPIKIKLVELFGSPINTQYNYCSAFDFEKNYFNSLGSFFDYDLEVDKIYIANPPFDESLMKQMSERLINQLDKTPNIEIIIIIPVWNPYDQNKLKIHNYGKPFEAYDLLIKSNYVYDKQILLKYDYKFYNYTLDKYVPLSNSHLILFTNKKKPLLDLKTISTEWIKYFFD